MQATFPYSKTRTSLSTSKIQTIRGVSRNSVGRPSAVQIKHPLGLRRSQTMSVSGIRTKRVGWMATWDEIRTTDKTRIMILNEIDRINDTDEDEARTCLWQSSEFTIQRGEIGSASSRRKEEVVSARSWRSQTCMSLDATEIFPDTNSEWKILGVGTSKARLNEGLHILYFPKIALEKWRE